jgi:phospholipid transport system substrate-binding protein
LSVYPDLHRSYISVSLSDETLKGAENFVGSVAERGIGFLSDSAISHEKRQASFKRLLQDSFDLDTIARFSLGRYWKVADDAQRKEYTKLFENMIIGVYSNRFGEYNGEKLEVKGSRAEGDNDILVNSAIIPTNGQEIQLDWRVRYKGGQYKVVDVIVEGVSMAVTQRSDFSSVIQRGGGNVGVLLAHLRQE